MLVKSKGWKVSAFAIGLAVVAVGCSQSDQPPVAGEASGVDEKQGVPAPKTEPVELGFFSNSGATEEKFNADYGDAIRKKFPHVTVKYYRAGKGFNYIQDLVATKTPVDILYDSIGNIPESLLAMQLNYDMTSLTKLYGVDLNQFEPELLQVIKGFSNKGEIFGLPVTTDTMWMYYNKDIFDKFGIAYPKDGMTWDETIELARKVTRVDGSTQYRGFSMSELHYLMMNQLSLPLVDPQTNKASINTDKWQSLYSALMKKPYDIPGNAPPKSADLTQVSTQLNTFAKDKVLAMWATLTGRQGSFTGTGLNWDVVSLPVLAERKGGGAQSYPTFFSVTATSTHKEQSFEIIQYLTSDEFQSTISRNGALPAVTNPEIRAVYGQNTEWKDKNLKAIFVNSYAPTPPLTKFNTKAKDIYGTYLLDVATGKQDINTVLRLSEEKVNEMIASEMAK